MGRNAKLCIEDLRNRGYATLANNMEVMSLVLEGCVGLANKHFPSVVEGTSEQAEIVIALLPLAVADNGEEEPDDQQNGPGQDGQPSAVVEGDNRTSLEPAPILGPGEQRNR